MKEKLSVPSKDQMEVTDAAWILQLQFVWCGVVWYRALKVKIAGL